MAIITPARARCSCCHALVAFNIPSEPTTFQCYNCHALMMCNCTADLDWKYAQRIDDGSIARVLNSLTIDKRLLARYSTSQTSQAILLQLLENEACSFREEDKGWTEAQCQASSIELIQARRLLDALPGGFVKEQAMRSCLIIEQELSLQQVIASARQRGAAIASTVVLLADQPYDETTWITIGEGNDYNMAELVRQSRDSRSLRVLQMSYEPPGMGCTEHSLLFLPQPYSRNPICFELPSLLHEGPKHNNQCLIHSCQAGTETYKCNIKEQRNSSNECASTYTLASESASNPLLAFLWNEFDSTTVLGGRCDKESTDDRQMNSNPWPQELEEHSVSVHLCRNGHLYCTFNTHAKKQVVE